MTKEDYQKVRAKEAQLEYLKEFKKTVECGKILNLKIRTFNEDRIEYEDIEFTDLPKRKIKTVILENLETRIESAKNDWESYFDDVSIKTMIMEKVILNHEEKGEVRAQLPGVSNLIDALEWVCERNSNEKINDLKKQLEEIRDELNYLTK